MSEPRLPAIEVDGLVQRYGPTTAVDGLSLEVLRGEVFGLLGPNGAGKTTTVETLEGYRAPREGRVRVLGLDPVSEGVELRPRIGVMLQEGGIYPGVRPLEALELFAGYYDDPDDPVRLLELVGPRRVPPHARPAPVGRAAPAAVAGPGYSSGAPSSCFLDEPTAGDGPPRPQHHLAAGARRCATRV